MPKLRNNNRVTEVDCIFLLGERQRRTKNCYRVTIVEPVAQVERQPAWFENSSFLYL